MKFGPHLLVTLGGSDARGITNTFAINELQWARLARIIRLVNVVVAQIMARRDLSACFNPFQPRILNLCSEFCCEAPHRIGFAVLSC